MLENKPNVITNFEVLEHVPQDYASKMLQHMYDISTHNAYLIMSTPVYYEKYGMAKNHINEMTRETTQKLLHDAGWNIKENFGTFSGKPELYDNMQPEHKRTWDALAKYYSIPVLSTILAPLYPEYSRNNLWVCTK